MKIRATLFKQLRSRKVKQMLKSNVGIFIYLFSDHLLQLTHSTYEVLRMIF